MSVCALVGPEVWWSVIMIWVLVVRPWSWLIYSAVIKSSSVIACQTNSIRTRVVSLKNPLNTRTPNNILCIFVSALFMISILYISRYRCIYCTSSREGPRVRLHAFYPAHPAQTITSYDKINWMINMNFANSKYDLFMCCNSPPWDHQLWKLSML